MHLLFAKLNCKWCRTYNTFNKW